jgi:hypothetical protein
MIAGLMAKTSSFRDPKVLSSARMGKQVPGREWGRPDRLEVRQ